MIRVLELASALSCGGVETWLLEVVRNLDPSEFCVDFFSPKIDPFYRKSIAAFGGRTLTAPPVRHIVNYTRELRRVLRTRGPYDVVHSHHTDHDGWLLRQAAHCGVGVRIAHAHTNFEPGQPRLSVARQMYFRLNQWLVRKHATCGLACSQQAAATAFGVHWSSDGRWKVLHCGINLRPFEMRHDRAAVRAELGIPADAFVVGHVGRFIPCKNHQFLIEVARETTLREPASVFLLVGDGPLYKTTQEGVDAAGISKSVIFAGVRRDVPRLLTYAMDAFILPSQNEGLPLVVIEAEAAGLPCLMSEIVSDEADVVPALMHRLSLSDSPAGWAEELLKLRTARLPQREPLRAVATSDFNIAHSADALASVYLQQYKGPLASEGARKQRLCENSL